MEAKVTLRFQAFSPLALEQMSTDVSQAIINSVCRCVERHATESNIRFTIAVTSDKLVKLYDSLQATQITFDQDYSAIINNAAQQYSVYRDIELILDITSKLDADLKRQQFRSLHLPFIAL
jgi:hypothetical protein